GLEKRPDACPLPLVLPPGPEASHAAPSVAAEPAEVVEREHPPAREHLEALLGEGARAVREVVNGPDGAVGELELEACGVAGRPSEIASRAADDGGAGEIAQQVDEVTHLPEDPPAADVRISGPVTRGHGASIHRHHHGPGPGHACEN